MTVVEENLEKTIDTRRQPPILSHVDTRYRTQVAVVTSKSGDHEGVYFRTTIQVSN